MKKFILVFRKFKKKKKKHEVGLEKRLNLTNRKKIKIRFVGIFITFAEPPRNPRYLESNQSY